MDADVTGVLLLTTKLGFVTETRLELVLEVGEGGVTGCLFIVFSAKVWQINDGEDGPASCFYDFVTAKSDSDLIFR